MQHLNHHNILHSPQSAYVPNKSTETALARINNNILANYIDTIIVFLDLSADFDTLTIQYRLLIWIMQVLHVKL